MNQYNVSIQHHLINTKLKYGSILWAKIGNDIIVIANFMRCKRPECTNEKLQVKGESNFCQQVMWHADPGMQLIVFDAKVLIEVVIDFRGAVDLVQEF